MFNIVIYKNPLVTVAEWSAREASSRMISHPGSPFEVSQAVMKKLPELLEALPRITSDTPIQYGKRQYWVWECGACGGWHATSSLPSAQRCSGLSPQDIADAKQHIGNARRKSSKRAAWNEAELAAQILGIQCPADELGRWPDLNTLEARLEAVRPKS